MAIQFFGLLINFSSAGSFYIGEIRIIVKTKMVRMIAG